MIFGTMHKEKADRSLSRGEELWFAWHPVRLNDGRWLWLDYVWRRWECDKFAPTNCGWHYKANP